MQLKTALINEPISKISLSKKWAEDRFLIKLNGCGGYWATDKTENFMIYMPNDLRYSKIVVLPLTIAGEIINDLEEFFDVYKNLDPLDYDVVYGEVY